MKTIVLATQNVHKLDELKAVLPEGWSIQTASEAGVRGELPEDGTSLEENATQKALKLWSHCKIPSLADDSGLEVDVLDGAPGVYSAMYAGPERLDSANRDLLLQKLQNTTNRTARFRTVLAWATFEGVELYEGVVHGSISHVERGSNGFGYDSIFIPDEGDGRTFAEMQPDEKIALSHRSRAVRLWLKGLERS